MPVRDIAAAAGVNVGVIPYYFGTKENLFQQVFQRLVRPLIEDRRKRIEQVYAEAGDGVPDMRKTLEADLAPVFLQSHQSDTYRRLLAPGVNPPDPPAGRAQRRKTRKVANSRPAVKKKRAAKKPIRYAAGETCPRLSPNPMEIKPSRRACARRMISSPSSRKVRVSPEASAKGSRPPSLISPRLP